MPLAAWFLALVTPFVARVLLALGFAVVTVTGVDVAIGALRSHVIAAAGSLPADVAALFFLAGGGVAINWIFGAIAFRLAFWTATRATRILARS